MLLVVSFYSILCAGDISYNKGEMLFFAKGCNGCHGAQAQGGGIYPRLANKKKSYLISKLRYFRKGKVSTQNQEMMVQFILHFSDEDIENMATFLYKHKKVEHERMDEDLFGGYGS